MTNKIEWQYFRPEHRPHVRYRGGDSKAVKLAINDGSTRTYREVNRVGNVIELKCKDLSVQVKHHENHGICDDFYSLRAICRTGFELLAEELGGGESVQVRCVDNIDRKFVASRGVLGTHEHQVLCEVTLGGTNRRDAMKALKAIRKYLKAVLLDDEAVSDSGDDIPF